MTKDAVDQGRRRRTALVVGASSGIGRATAKALAAADWNVVLAARSATGLSAAQSECDALGTGDCVSVPVDVKEDGRVRALFAAATDQFGTIDAVVNSAAVIAYGRFAEVPADIFDRVIGTNVLGTANVARSSLEQFAAQRGGHLVVVGSVLGKIVVPFMSSYCTSKAAVHALTRAIRIEARQTPGVQVTLISPGSVDTPVYRQAATYAGHQGQPPPPVVAPERVAAAIVKSLAQSRRDRSIGPANPLMVFGFRAFPAIFDAIVTPLMRRLGLSAQATRAHPGNVMEPRPDLERTSDGWTLLGRRAGARP